MFSEQDYFYMQRAIDLAITAGKNNEVPVGSLLVLNDKIIGEGANCPIQTSDPTAHAEIVAIRQGSSSLQNYRLVNSTLYVTLEPCAMCLGALVHARVKRLVFGTLDPKSGAVVSVLQLPEATAFNHRIVCEGGLMAEECGHLLSSFFKARRLDKI